MTAAEVTGDFHGGDRRGRQVPALQRLGRDCRHRSGHTGGRYGSHVDGD